MKTFAPSQIFHVLCVSLSTLWLASIPLRAQLPTFDWVTRLSSGGGARVSVGAAADGSALLAYGQDFAVGTNLATLNQRGGLIWTQSAPAPVWGLNVDTTGKLYVTGRVNTNLLNTNVLSAAGVIPQGNGDAFLAQYDASGTLQWMRLDGVAQPYIFVFASALDALGNHYVAGNYKGTLQFGSIVLPPAAELNAFIASHDATGRLRWARASEGSEYAIVNSMAADPAGNLLVTGFGHPTVTFGDVILTADEDIAFLIRFDKDGKPLWGQQLDGRGTVAVDNDGNAFAAVAVEAFGGSNQLQLSKYSPSGERLWTQQAEGALWGRVSVGSTGVTVDREGNCFVAGVYEAASNPPFIGALSFGDVSFRSVGDDLFVAKYASSGQLRWALSSKAKDPVGNGFAYRQSHMRNISLALDPLGGCFVAGGFMGTYEFGATNLVGNATQVNPFPGYDVFVTHVTDPDTATPPTVRIARVPSGVSLSWPVASAGFGLEVSNTLAPAPTWSAAASAPVVLGDQNVVTITAAGRAKFFRLKKP